MESTDSPALFWVSLWNKVAVRLAVPTNEKRTEVSLIRTDTLAPGQGPRPMTQSVCGETLLLPWRLAAQTQGRRLRKNCQDKQDKEAEWVCFHSQIRMYSPSDWILTWVTISWSSLTSLSRHPVVSSSCRCNAGEIDSPTTFSPGMLKGKHTQKHKSPSKLRLCLCLCWVAQSSLTLCYRMNRWYTTRLLCPPGSSVNGDSPGKNTGVGCHVLLKLRLLTCQ